MKSTVLKERSVIGAQCKKKRRAKRAQSCRGVVNRKAFLRSKLVIKNAMLKERRAN